MQKNLILASSSKNRLELLKRLKIGFKVIVPNVDETPLKSESPAHLVLRLAEKKASAALNKYLLDNDKTPVWVIGSDQVLEVNKKIFGKPETIDKAYKQLQFFSEKKGIFHTSVCLIVDGKKKVILKDNVKTKVRFRKISQSEIKNYLHKEDTLGCAGSFKSEGLGLSLLKWIKSSDHSAIIGLPLIQLSEMLRETDFIARQSE